MGHSEGICHVYIDKDADPTKAVDVTVDAKVRYTRVVRLSPVWFELGFGSARFGVGLGLARVCSGLLTLSFLSATRFISRY